MTVVFPSFFPEIFDAASIFQLSGIESEFFLYVIPWFRNNCVQKSVYWTLPNAEFMHLVRWPPAVLKINLSYTESDRSKFRVDFAFAKKFNLASKARKEQKQFSLPLVSQSASECVMCLHGKFKPPDIYFHNPHRISFRISLMEWRVGERVKEQKRK